MGGGGVFQDRDGRWISGFAASLGAGDAFKAKLLAARKGLSHVWEMGYRSVVCYMDCLQAQEVIASDRAVDNFWHRDVILAIRELINRDWSVSVIHVPREKNKVADALAKLTGSED